MESPPPPREAVKGEKEGKGIQEKDGKGIGDYRKRIGKEGIRKKDRNRKGERTGKKGLEKRKRVGIV